MNLLARKNRRYRTLHAGLNDPLTVVSGPELRDVIAAPHEGVRDGRIRETPREWNIDVK